MARSIPGQDFRQVGIKQSPTFVLASPKIIWILFLPGRKQYLLLLIVRKLARLKAILVFFLSPVLKIFLDYNWPDRGHSWILGRKYFEESGCAGLAGNNPGSVGVHAWTPANNIRFCFFHCSVSSVFCVIFFQRQMKTRKQRPNLLYIQNLMHVLDN
jgi:hypothetical protein